MHPEDRLAALADHPPFDATDPSEIRRRARGRMRRRRTLLAAAGLMAAVGLGVVVGLAVDGDLGEDVATAGGPSSEVVAGASSAATAPPDTAGTADPSGRPGSSAPDSSDPSVVNPSGDRRAEVAGAGGQVRDGGRLLITLTGVETGDDVIIRQCLVGVPTSVAVDGRGCSAVRGLATTVQHGPETQVTFIVFHDVWVSDTGAAPRWTTCAPCEVAIWAGPGADPIARVPLTMRDVEAPIRPSVLIDPPVVRRGGVAAVTIADLQPRETVGIEWCDLTDEGAPSGLCGQPSGDLRSLTIGADGSLSEPAFPAPSTGAGPTCASAAGRCGLVLRSGAGTLFLVLPVDLAD